MAMPGYDERAMTNVCFSNSECQRTLPTPSIILFQPFSFPEKDQPIASACVQALLGDTASLQWNPLSPGYTQITLIYSPADNSLQYFNTYFPLVHSFRIIGRDMTTNQVPFPLPSFQ